MQPHEVTRPKLHPHLLLYIQDLLSFLHITKEATLIITLYLEGFLKISFSKDLWMYVLYEEDMILGYIFSLLHWNNQKPSNSFH